MLKITDLIKNLNKNIKFITTINTLDMFNHHNLSEKN